MLVAIIARNGIPQMPRGGQTAAWDELVAKFNDASSSSCPKFSTNGVKMKYYQLKSFGRFAKSSTQLCTPAEIEEPVAPDGVAGPGRERGASGVGAEDMAGEEATAEVQEVQEVPEATAEKVIEAISVPAMVVGELVVAAPAVATPGNTAFPLCFHCLRG